MNDGGRRVGAPGSWVCGLRGYITYLLRTVELEVRVQAVCTEYTLYTQYFTSNVLAVADTLSRYFIQGVSQTTTDPSAESDRGRNCRLA